MRPLMKFEAEGLKRNPPKLYPGERMPGRPSYWLIWIVDDKERPMTSRACWDKVLTPVEASIRAYDISPTPAMRFFCLGSTVVDARRRLTQIGNLWRAAKI